MKYGQVNSNPQVSIRVPNRREVNNQKYTPSHRNPFAYLTVVDGVCPQL